MKPECARCGVVEGLERRGAWHTCVKCNLPVVAKAEEVVAKWLSSRKEFQAYVLGEIGKQLSEFNDLDNELTLVSPIRQDQKGLEFMLESEPGELWVVRLAIRLERK